MNTGPFFSLPKTLEKFQNMIKHLCTYNHNIKYIRFQPLEKIKKHPDKSHTKFEDLPTVLD